MSENSPRVHTALLWIAFIISVAAVRGAPEAHFRSADRTEQLAPGKKPGTFAFSYTNSVQFSQERAFPVNVLITSYLVVNDLTKARSLVKVSDSSPFMILADLPPGGYWVSVQMPLEKNTLYWSSGLISVLIDPHGLATIHDPLIRPLTLKKKMTVDGPMGNVVMTDKRPVLKWEPLTGATNYQVFWSAEEPGKPLPVGGNNASTSDTQLTIPEDLLPGRRYQWSVFGKDATGRELGYWSAAFFYTPGGKEAFQKAGPWPTTARKGAAYLGISPRPGGSSGIVVMNVLAGSPALAAGLKPNDVLTSFNDKQLNSLSIGQFVELVRAQPIGSVVTISYTRDGVAKSAQVTVASMP